MRLACAVVLAASLVALRPLGAQERGAAALGEAVEGLGVTARVLVIGAHPDDEDTQLITWLAKGRHVETAYLSLTRGDGGQNLIGNELGPVLGMIRTEELLAARRLDGGHQFFTRAFDFGFSKTADETFKHWPRDSILRDMISVVRAFRPQVIVAVFSGTPRDGHGHHQVSGILAREAFDLAADTIKYPRSATNGMGAWTPLKFYRAARNAPGGATVGFNVGEYSPLLGRSYSEIASESRSQHLSQGFGGLQSRGARMDYVRLEATHLAVANHDHEQTLFDGVDTSLARFATLPLASTARAALDSLPLVGAEVMQRVNLRDPSAMVAPLAHYVSLAQRARAGTAACWKPSLPVPICADGMGDLATTLDEQQRRAVQTVLLAAGVVVEATAPRELIAVGDTIPVTVTVYNQGRVPVSYLGRETVEPNGALSNSESPARIVEPDNSAQEVFRRVDPAGVAPSWWLARPRDGDVFRIHDASETAGQPNPNLLVGEDRIQGSDVRVRLEIAGVDFVTDVAPIVYRFADPARGELRRPIATVPAISILLEHEVEYARANTPLDRAVHVTVHSAATNERHVDVRLQLPRGLSADSAVRTVTLKGGASANLYFRVRGTLAPGAYQMSAAAISDGATYTLGYTSVEYAHIRPLRVYRQSSVQLQVVDVKYPVGLTLAYIPGVGDNVEPMLEELGLKTTVIDPAALPQTDLSKFSAVVVGTRAFGASAALVANNSRLMQYVRGGGTLVEQYGQNEMGNPGIMPFPVTYARPADRVTEEDAEVRVLNPQSPLLNTPNRITEADFKDWVQERALYMPHTFDSQYHAVLSMNDTGEPPNDAAILVAAVGKGTYVYTTLAFFRQLPAGNPGAARLFVNLLAADQRAATGPPPRQIPHP